VSAKKKNVVISSLALAVCCIIIIIIIIIITRSKHDQQIAILAITQPLQASVIVKTLSHTQPGVKQHEVPVSARKKKNELQKTTRRLAVACGRLRNQTDMLQTKRTGC